jgi:hypothetical protein
MIRCEPRYANIFVHVERDHMFETQLALPVILDEISVGTNWRGTRGQSEDERPFWSGFKRVDALFNVGGCYINPICELPREDRNQ